MTSPAPALSEIGRIAFIVGDVARATAFFRDVLGLRFLFAAGPAMAFLAAGDIRLMLTSPQGAGGAGRNSILCFRVADLAATHAALVARGAAKASDPRLIARMPGHELRMAAIRDPEGNVIELMSEVRA